MLLSRTADMPEPAVPDAAPEAAEPAGAPASGGDTVPAAVPLPDDAGLLDQVFARHL